MKVGKPEGTLIDFSACTAVERYQLLTQSVVPRPIAWVLTDNGSGEGLDRYNLAPFSFFNAVCAAPPLLAVAIQKRAGGTPKDTLRNLEARKKATVHISDEGLLDALVDSSVDLPHGDSELLRKPYTLKEGPEGFLPRIDGTPLAFFGTLDHIHWLGENEKKTTAQKNTAKKNTGLAFIRVEHLYIAPHCCDKDTKGRFCINQQHIKAVARMGKLNYTVTERIMEKQRPESPQVNVAKGA